MLTSSLCLAALALSAAAAPSPKQPGISIPLRRRAQPQTTDEIQAQARRMADTLIAKYKPKGHSKRAGTASEPLTDFNVDFQYYGSISVGTPAKSYDVILDTGSSDLWLASSQCDVGCSSVTNPFDTSASSSFKNTQLPIDIQYGSGEVQGIIGNDTVTMQGFTIQGQGMGVMTTLSANVLQGSLSGLMGLAWPDLAQTGATPWWLAVANSNAWTSPMFGFYLARFIDDASAQTVESQGGSMDLGFANTNYYSGDINYITLTGENYWLIPLESISIDSKKLTPGGQAAIDTGTSLIGGPSDTMAQLYAQIPGAQAGTGQLEGYYIYPCSTKVTVSLGFGGQTYSIASEDFSRPADSTGTTCFGSFFPLDINNGVVEWIVGDSFLKNVYSVYRASPPAVGFATVKSSDNSASILGSPTPSIILGILTTSLLRPRTPG
ncbi:acid protease [Clavulina sp. PMI_390]|nr:acid protease [Clavulina sp. PMI_390]